MSIPWTSWRRGVQTQSILHSYFVPLRARGHATGDVCRFSAVASALGLQIED